MKPHYTVVVVGGGQAGLSVSYCLGQLGVEHVVLEQHGIGYAWREQRWDSFCLVTPNWQCQLPGYAYSGSEPDGFMAKREIVEYLENYVAHTRPPLCLGVSVARIRFGSGVGRFELETSEGPLTADHVVMAVGAYHRPIVPPFAEQLSAHIVQINSRDYKNPQGIPEGDVLVVGSGQSGCQIAEDLFFAGRTVHLCLGDAPRSPRVYRGKDVVAWLDEMGYYDLPVEAHPNVNMTRDKTNHYLTGRDGGREIDLRRLALQGMNLYGFLKGMSEFDVEFEPDLAARLDAADSVYNGIRKLIDDYIAKRGLSIAEEPPYIPPWAPERESTKLNLQDANVKSVIWCIGFRSDFGFVEIPVFDIRGYPRHTRGISEVEGLYFIGLPWLHTWGSGRFAGVGRDAKHIAEHIETMERFRHDAALTTSPEEVAPASADLATEPATTFGPVVASVAADTNGSV